MYISGYYKWKRKQSLPKSRIKSLLNAHSQFLMQFLSFFLNRCSSLLSFGGPQLYFGSYANQLFLCYEQRYLSSYDVCALQRYTRRPGIEHGQTMAHYCTHLCLSIYGCTITAINDRIIFSLFCFYFFKTVSRNTSTENILTNCI